MSIADIILIIIAVILFVVAWLLIFSGVKIENQIKAKNKLKNEFECLFEIIVAQHEAGHAIVAWYCKNVEDINYVKLNIIDDKVISGSTNETHKFLLESKSDMIIHHWCSLVINMAGAAGEIYGSATSSLEVFEAGLQADLLNAIVDANRILEIDKSFGLNKAYSTELDQYNIDLCKNLSLDQRALLYSAYTEAKRLIQKHEDDYNTIVHALLVNKELSSEDLKQILPERFFFQFLRPDVRELFV